MHAETEGKPFLHVSSLKHEGLLAPDFQSGPVSLFIAFSRSGRRVWQVFSGGETQTIGHPLCLRAPRGQVRATLSRGTWTRTDKFGRVQVLRIFSLSPTARTFTLTWEQEGGPSTSTVSAVGFRRSVGTYSGFRWWWVCPRCGRNVTALYFAHAPMGCRKCHDLVYHSERLSRRRRPFYRQRPRRSIGKFLSKLGRKRGE